MCKPKRKFSFWEDVIIVGDDDSCKLAKRLHELPSRIYEAISITLDRYLDRIYLSSYDGDSEFELAEDLLFYQVSSIGWFVGKDDDVVVHFSFFPFNCKVSKCQSR